MSTVTNSPKRSVKKRERKPVVSVKTSKFAKHPVSGLPVLKVRPGREPVTPERVGKALND